VNIEGVNAVSTSVATNTNGISSPAGPPAAANIADSNTSGNNSVDSSVVVDKENKESSGGMPPLKSMSTSDFLTLHNTNFESNNLMDRLLKILEAVLALELLDKTLETIKEGNNFKETA